MKPTRELPPVKRMRVDRAIYTFALAPMPDDTRQSGMVIVWHEDGRMLTYFAPDVSIVKEPDADA